MKTFASTSTSTVPSRMSLRLSTVSDASGARAARRRRRRPVRKADAVPPLVLDLVDEAVLALVGRGSRPDDVAVDRRPIAPSAFGSTWMSSAPRRDRSRSRAPAPRPFGPGRTVTMSSTATGAAGAVEPRRDADADGADGRRRGRRRRRTGTCRSRPSIPRPGTRASRAPPETTAPFPGWSPGRAAAPSRRPGRSAERDRDPTVSPARTRAVTVRGTGGGVRGGIRLAHRDAHRRRSPTAVGRLDRYAAVNSPGFFGAR